MTAETFFLIAMLLFVVAVTVLKMVADVVVERRRIQCAIAEIQGQVADAYTVYETAQKRHDRYQTEETEAAERRARDEYRRWRNALEYQLDIADKAGVQY